MFWTTLGVLATLISLISLVRPVLHVSGRSVQLGPWPTVGVLGTLLVVHIQLVYATWLRLDLDQAGISFRNLLGTHRVAWADVETIANVSALTPQGRGGNVSALCLQTARGTLTIPDVFTMRRNALRTAMMHYGNLRL